jgi:hypothetical protein
MFMPRAIAVQAQPKREAISYFDNYITESTDEADGFSRENLTSGASYRVQRHSPIPEPRLPPKPKSTVQ